LLRPRSAMIARRRDTAVACGVALLGVVLATGLGASCSAHSRHCWGSSLRSR